MLKKAILARMISVAIFATFCVQVSFSQTTYYVDPAFNGTRNGSASNPWQSLSDNATPTPWNAINAALAKGPVTVYLTACNTSCTANTVTTSPISITRTDTGANELTLDGISKYNTSESSPSWATNVIPAPCTGFRCAATAPFASAHKYQVGVIGTGISYPIQTNSSFSNCYGYITLQGMQIIRSEGQIINATYIHDLTLQYIDASSVNGGTLGPGVIAGPAQNGPCHTGPPRPNGTESGPDNVVVQYNYIHNTYEDCVYLGASTPDPPGYGGSEYSGLALNCASSCSTGANDVIQYNTLESCSAAGGTENVGINIKDGHSSLKVIGNTIRATLNVNNGQTGPGINLESGGLITDNYIEAPATNGIAPSLGWNTATGRSYVTIENNIVVNANTNFGHNAGVMVFSPNSGANQLWQAVSIYNNSFYNLGNQSGDPCIVIQSGSVPSALAIVKNNIMDDCNMGGAGFTADSGTLASHSNNLYYQSTALNGASCSGSEPGVVCSNPQYVSTNIPYSDSNFALQAGSPAASAALDLASIFNTDYFGNARSDPWDMGAIALNTSGGGAPNPPTALVVTVN
jgi:hypothetical protein